MLYGHIKKSLFKVLGSVIYFIIDKFVCLYYLCLQEYLLSSNDRVFENPTFDNMFGTVITEVLINIMTCHKFSKEEKKNFSS